MRFDLERRDSIQFEYDSSGHEYDSESEDDKGALPSFCKQVASAFNFTRQQSHAHDDTQNDSSKDIASNFQNWTARSKVSNATKKVGSRFTVSNVPENEHVSQMGKSSSNEFDDDSYSHNFANIKKIDILLKNENNGKGDYDVNVEQIRHGKELLMAEMKMNEEKKGIFSPKKSDVDYLGDLSTHLQKQHEQQVRKLMTEYEEKMETFKKDLELRFEEERKLWEVKMQKRLEDLKREMADKEEREIAQIIEEMEQEKLENLKKVRSELETCYDKERQDILSNLKTELNQRKQELLDLRNSEISKLEVEHEKTLNDERQAKESEYQMTMKHSKNVETMKSDLEKEYEEQRNHLIAQHEEKVAKIMSEHEHNLAKILRDYKIDVSCWKYFYTFDIHCMSQLIVILFCRKI